MKRLGVILAGTVLAIGLFGGFSAPTHVSAQSTQASTDKANYLKNFGIDLFDKQITLLRNSSGDGSEKFKKDVEASIKLTQYAKSVFIGSYNADIQEKSTFSSALKNTPEEAYTASANAAAYAVEHPEQANTKYGDRALVLTPEEVTSANDLKGFFRGTSFNTKFAQLLRVSTPPDFKDLRPPEEIAKNPTPVLSNAEKEVAATVASDADASTSKCLWYSWTVGDCVSEFTVWFIKKVFLNIAGWMLWLTANIFNYSIQIGILQFKDWAPETLYPIWVLVRQILSLVIVFVGLYLGFMYILGKEEKFSHYMPWVVVFALFVNFSYPLTRTAIDISNIVSLKIYASTLGDGALVKNPDQNSTAGGIIVNRLGLYGLAASATKVNETDGKGNNTLLKGINSIPGALAVVIFIAYAAYIFLVASGIMIMRTASLVFLTIASPLLLVDSVIPLLGEHAMKLRKFFLEQLIVAPVFMIMLSITLQFLEIFSSSGVIKINGIGDVGSNGQGTIITLFNITMMLIMLHITLKVTRRFAGDIGNFAGDALGKFGKFAGGAVGGFALGAATGGVGLLARSSIGRGAASMTQEGGRLDRWQTKNGVTGAVGRRMFNFTDSIAKSSFDARNTSVVQTRASKLGLSSGMGAGVKKGYQELQEDRAGRRLETRDRVIKRALNLGKNKKEAEQEGDKYIKQEMESKVGSRFLGTYGNKKLETTLSEQDKTREKEFNTLYSRYQARSKPEDKKKYLADFVDNEDMRQKILTKEQEDLATKTPEATPSATEPTNTPVAAKQWDNGIDFTTETPQPNSTQQETPLAEKSTTPAETTGKAQPNTKASSSTSPAPSYSNAMSTGATTLNGTPTQTVIPNPKTTNLTEVFAKKKTQAAGGAGTSPKKEAKPQEAVAA